MTVAATAVRYRKLSVTILFSIHLCCLVTYCYILAIPNQQRMVSSVSGGNVVVVVEEEDEAESWA